MSIRIAIVGLGKIAWDQHLPAIAATPGIELAAVVSRNARHAEVPSFASLAELIASGTAFDTVALCTPPQVRTEQARQALAAGRHVLLEKPPGATVGEIAPLVAAARERRLALFASWHSRHAPAVETARTCLAGVEIRSVSVVWKEDVRVWHPGQAWIFEPGGLGVFDPGVNAISILTRILPWPIAVISAEFAFPSNKAAPIAAEIAFASPSGCPIRAELDFLQTGPQSWDIRIDTTAGEFLLSSGGRKLERDGQTLVDGGEPEYLGLYRHFVDLVGRREVDADLSPLALVADAFLIARRRTVAPFGDG